jgi:hypothetical protein
MADPGPPVVPGQPLPGGGPIETGVPTRATDGEGTPVPEYAGDSFACVTPGVAGPNKLSSPVYKQCQSGIGKVGLLIAYAPDGTDPPGTGDLAANTATMRVGPNGRATFPLAPGSALPFYNIDPADFAIDDGGTAGYVHITYGGCP